MAALRILQVTRDFPPFNTGGISTAVGGLVKSLDRRRVESLILSFDGWRPVSRPDDDQGFSVASEDGLQIWRVRTPRQLDAAMPEICRLGLDLVHVHHGMLWAVTDAISVNCRVVTTHVLQRQINRLRGVDRETMSLVGQTRALASADEIIAPSKVAMGILERDDPSLAGKLRHIGFGAPITSARRNPATDPLVLYVGRFGDVKGTAELLQALPRMLEAVPNLKVVIAGGNPESPKSDRRWRRRFLEALTDQQRARVDLPGWLSPPELAQLYAKSWVLLCPSWFETFGLAALEAMAHGLPVVATAAGALPELISDQRNGRLVPVRNPEALAGTAVDLISHPEECERLGRRARADARQRHSWESVAEQHEDLYESLPREP